MSVEITSKQIQNLRSAFLKELEIKGESFAHPNDLERIKSGDDWLRRFLLHHDGGEKEALNMLLDAVQWRKEFKTNEINETNINIDFIKEGILFAHGKDKDGCTLFIFKCRKHQKGQKDFEEIKRCVVYWLERLERQDNGKPVTIFFDMEGCGVSNVDMELIKYIIQVFKQYYPFFLNYILILEMAWILNAVFKVIKTMLPEKAVQKIKFLKKNDLNQFVDPDQTLTCWGGNDNYSFVFVPEAEESAVTHINTTINKKVHFADGSSMSDNSSGFGDSKDQGDGGVLKVLPSTVITFAKEGNELVGTLELYNSDNQISISYKMKTTSPEKFRVRPNLGCLAPGSRATINVSLMPGFHLGGLSRDKFLVMSMPINSVEMSPQELSELWKNSSNKNVSQHRLNCAQATSDAVKNGNAVATGLSGETENNQLNQLSARMSKLIDSQSQLSNSLKRTQTLQIITMFLVITLSVTIIWMLKKSVQVNSSAQFCYKNDDAINQSP